ncbi:retinol dehydrogenase 13 isoform X2 [Alligator mississippiensis]|uniref:retinol dehydrogenase 13 isoform X2 n=1 Tax=Alligator mississippiensis TaxID=8496 RepID=UPI000906F809|nr:retinol dehydrogenase 13 isoform X2 [Alligator mississippiensis]
MELASICSHPGWCVTTLGLALLLWVKRRWSWQPRHCPTDLTGKTAIVTGANTGIGKCVALDLARRNARTILACRSQERGQAAVAEIRRATGNPHVLLRLVDTSSMASVRHFAQQVLQEEERLDILVNNAGLTDLLRRSAPARIVNVSSFKHKTGKIDLQELTGKKPSNVYHVYSSTKLMNILFTNELARRLQGTGVTVNALNPGVVRTEIMRHFSWPVRALFSLAGLLIKTPEEGATSTIYCAVSEEVSGVTGKYFDSDCALVLPVAPARDPVLARKLWEVSEQLTGLGEGLSKAPTALGHRRRTGDELGLGEAGVPEEGR